MRALPWVWVLGALVAAQSPSDSVSPQRLKAEVDRVLAKRVRELRAELHQLIDRALPPSDAPGLEGLLRSMEGSPEAAPNPENRPQGFEALGVVVTPLTAEEARIFGGRPLLSVKVERLLEACPLAHLGLAPGAVVLGVGSSSDGQAFLRLAAASGEQRLPIPAWMGQVLGAAPSIRTDLPEGNGKGLSLEHWTPAMTKELLRSASDAALQEVLRSGPTSVPVGGAREANPSKPQDQRDSPGNSPPPIR
jgi:hypothetical protein